MKKLLLIITITLITTGCVTSTELNNISIQNKNLEIESISKGIIEKIETTEDGYIYTIKLRRDERVINIAQEKNSLKVGDSVTILHNEEKTKVIKKTSE